MNNVAGVPLVRVAGVLLVRYTVTGGTSGQVYRSGGTSSQVSRSGGTSGQAYRSGGTSDQVYCSGVRSGIR